MSHAQPGFFDRLDAAAPMLDQALALERLQMLEDFAAAVLFGRQAMPLLQEDGVDAQVPQRQLGRLAGHVQRDPLRPLQAQIDPQLAAELGGDVDLLLRLLQELADRPFADAHPVHVGRVEEVDAQFDRAMENPQRVGFRDLPPIGAAQLPSPQTDLGHLGSRLAQRAILHGSGSWHVKLTEDSLPLGRRRVNRVKQEFQRTRQLEYNARR